MNYPPNPQQPQNPQWQPGQPPLPQWQPVPPPNTQWGPPPPMQPGQYPQQPMPPGAPPPYPGQMRPPMMPPPKKKMPLWQKVLIGIAVGFVALCALVNGINRATASPTDQPTATVAAPPTEKPTQAPTPTPTSKPLSTEQRIMAIIKENGGVEGSGLYIEEQKFVQATMKLGTQWDAAGARDAVKMDCYRMQKALWNDAQPALDLESVVVFIQGDFVDQFGNEKESQAGACTLKKPTEAKFNWGNLTWRTAWEVYDFKSMHPALANA